ncbi:hypothetical protein [Tumebacillus flagellatus]|uniref:Uncharacterized protein n=1 Tax=Tumebacillus flagellatus TaxID=1157490 RepID=A0A074MBZ3_9BACL|nr:hypothetical protein [Tumebacillus flagellatus]KEO83417.1 hypothetical protein EL26_10610 [Tumebacillus flagellatus]
MWKFFLTAVSLVCALMLGSGSAHAALEPERILVFDVKKQEVVKKIDNTPALQAEAKNWLGTITGLSPRVHLGMDKGLVVKIPMDPPTRVENQWMNDEITEIDLILRPGEKPAMLLFSEDNQARVFEFSHDVDKFLRKTHLRYQ